MSHLHELRQIGDSTHLVGAQKEFVKAIIVQGLDSYIDLVWAIYNGDKLRY